MREETVSIIDRLLTNAIDEYELENSFTVALDEMSDVDRSGLATYMVDRARIILESKGIEMKASGIPDYVARRLFTYVHDDDVDESPVLSSFDLVNECIDNCIEEHHLTTELNDHLVSCGHAGRLEICDILIDRVTHDVDARLPQYCVHPIRLVFEELLRARLAERAGNMTGAQEMILKGLTVNCPTPVPAPTMFCPPPAQPDAPRAVISDAKPNKDDIRFWLPLD